MDETANQIEAHIDRTRERLGSNLKELEAKVEAATDWREQFRERPHLFIGAAFVGGAILAGAVGAKTLRRGGETRVPHVRRMAPGGSSAQAQALELWDNVKAALIGVASSRIKQYIGESVPGFDDHYRRAEQRAAATNPATLELGRPT